MRGFGVSQSFVNVLRNESDNNDFVERTEEGLAMSWFLLKHWS